MDDTSMGQAAALRLAGDRGGGVASQKHIILVHGACHGGWSWYKVAARLQQRQLAPGGGSSYRVAAPDLAASGVDARRLREVPTFRAYTEPLLDVLRSLPDGEKAVLVGHSFGGLSLALACELFPEKVAAAVFLAAFVPDCSSPPSHVLQQHAEGNVSTSDNEFKPQDEDGKLPVSFMFGPQFMEQKLYQLCSTEDITLGKSLMRVGSLFVDDLQKQQPFSKDRYGSVRKVYVVCKQDEGIPDEFQRWMATNGAVDEVKEIGGADHMAMLTAPDEVVDCIVDVAETYH